jgi:hypothetical protein
MAPISTQLRETQDTVLERMFSAQDRLSANARTALAGGLRKVPGVQRASERLQQFAMESLFSRTSSSGAGTGASEAA